MQTFPHFDCQDRLNESNRTIVTYTDRSWPSILIVRYHVDHFVGECHTLSNCTWSFSGGSAVRQQPFLRLAEEISLDSFQRSTSRGHSGFCRARSGSTPPVAFPDIRSCITSSADTPISRCRHRATALTNSSFGVMNLCSMKTELWSQYTICNSTVINLFLHVEGGGGACGIRTLLYF